MLGFGHFLLALAAPVRESGDAELVGAVGHPPLGVVDVELVDAESVIERPDDVVLVAVVGGDTARGPDLLLLVPRAVGVAAIRVDAQLLAGRCIRRRRSAGERQGRACGANRAWGPPPSVWHTTLARAGSARVRACRGARRVPSLGLLAQYRVRVRPVHRGATAGSFAWPDPLGGVGLERRSSSIPDDSDAGRLVEDAVHGGEG